MVGTGSARAAGPAGHEETERSYDMDSTFGFSRHPEAASRNPLRADAIAALTNWLMTADVRAIEPLAESEESFVCRLFWNAAAEEATRELHTACVQHGVLPSTRA